MNQDLFSVQESLSPYQAFLKRHAPQVHANKEVDPTYTAYLDGQFADAIDGVIDPESLGYGMSEKEAILDLACKQKLEGFDTFDWEL